MPEAPKSIVYLRPDTMGDLVIFSAAIESLMAEWPGARHTIVVRESYSKLAPLFPPKLEWRAVRFNPFSQKPSECRAELGALIEGLRETKPDLVVAAALNRTWMEPAVAASFPKARRVALGAKAVDPHYATQLDLELGVDAAKAFNEIVEVDEGIRDWENNHRLVTRLAGRDLPHRLPKIEVPAEAQRAAAAWMKKQKLSAGKWLALFVGGLANVPIKAWPDSSYADLARLLQSDPALPIVVMGHESEAAVVNAIADSVAARGGKRPLTWLGRDGEVPLLAALLAGSRAYVGNDTGAMHIAAATGRPVLGIFGGGHWPRFRPAAAQGLSIVQPLPCFGCNWDCEFGDAPCVKLIPVDAVAAAARKLLAAGDAAIDEVATIDVLPAESLRLVAAVTPRFRELQRDRLDRQHRIEELKSETDSKDTEIADIKRAAEERKTEMESIKAELEAECAEKDTEIAGLKQESNTKDTEIADLKRAADERKAEMESIKAELEAECAEKDTEIAGLKAEANTKDAEIAALKDVCNEREALIFTQAGHIKNFQASVAQLREEAVKKDSHIGNLDKERSHLVARMKASEAALARAEGVLKTLPKDASTWADTVSMMQVHIRNIEAMVVLRDRRISELEQSVDNHSRGYGALEAAKHYGRLLSEKEAAIQTLDKACREREELIKQLAADSTGLTSRLHKLAIAARSHAREKWIRPFRAWLFRKVVEDFWMQIGVLQHYPPRPLRWDRFKTPRLPVEKLPQIAVVTPSFQQATFVESTILSVLNQKYPRLLYVVQDGGSSDGTPGIIERYQDRLAHWESVRDSGQADAVRRGFAHVHGRLGPDDVMGWLNSDDFIAPRALRFVGEYFATHPEVDCVYGNRIIIDANDREVGRWIMPTHDPRSLEWIDYVPQETLFWRRRAWDLVGGIDTSYQFALDWDLLARFTQAGMRIVRLPYFLGCFRVHPTQKTSAAIHTTGASEMARVRSRFHGEEKQGDMETINRWARRIRFRGALHARFHAAGIRW